MNIHLIIDNAYVKVCPDQAVAVLQDKLKELCAIRYETFVRDWRTHRLTKVNKVFTLYKKGGFVPSGLLPELLAFCKDRDFTVTQDDSRKQFPFRVLPVLPSLVGSLRDYQLDALNQIRAISRGIIKLPTGAGKTRLAAATASVVGCKTLMIVPNLELLQQTTREMIKIFGVQYVGVIGDGRFESAKPFIVATAQTLWSRLETYETSEAFSRVGCLLLDECHHVSLSAMQKGENTWFRIAQRIPAYWRYGLTATPGEESDPSFRMLRAATHKIIYDKPIAELVEEGWLSVPKIIMINCSEHGAYKDWPTAKKYGLSLNKARNERIAHEALQLALQGKRVLIVVDRVETHGQELFNIIGSKYAEFVHGSSDSAKRSRARKEFVAGTKPILIGTIFGEGVDFPTMDCVINAAGGKSDRATIQRFGRVLRTAKGKTEGICIDFFDIDKGKKYLMKHSIARRATYEELSFTVEAKS